MTPCYLRLLRDEGAAAENLARVLSAGRLAPDLLLRAPEAVALLGDPEGLRPRGRAHLEQEVLAAVGRADGAEQAIAAARGVRQREMFRTAAADVLKSARSASGAVRPIVSWPPPTGDGAPATPPTPRVPRDAPPAAEIPGALRDPSALSGRGAGRGRDSRELVAAARYLGYGPGHVGEMLDYYRRTTHRARAVTERLFYGYES